MSPGCSRSRTRSASAPRSRRGARWEESRGGGQGGGGGVVERGQVRHGRHRGPRGPSSGRGEKDERPVRDASTRGELAEEGGQPREVLVAEPVVEARTI